MSTTGVFKISAVLIYSKYFFYIKKKSLDFDVLYKETEVMFNFENILLVELICVFF